MAEHLFVFLRDGRQCAGLGAEDAELDGLRQELQHALSLPEQLFGDSHLRLTHEASGVTVDFSALDALRCALRRLPGLRLHGCCCLPPGPAVPH